VHIELSRISNSIVREKFSSPRMKDESTSKVSAALQKLQTWKLQLPPKLQISEELHFSDTSCYRLHMAYNQLVLLTTCPDVFAAIMEKLKSPATKFHDYRESYTKTCADAAAHNLRLARGLTQAGGKLLRADLLCLFNAAVISLLDQLLSSLDRNRSESLHSRDVSASIDWATKTTQKEAHTGTRYAIDCRTILDNLYRYVTTTTAQG
jgi:hypothetical protein